MKNKYPEYSKYIIDIAGFPVFYQKYSDAKEIALLENNDPDSEFYQHEIIVVVHPFNINGFTLEITATD